MAFLGIRIEPTVARLFRSIEVPGEKVAESEYHITILMFENEWPIAEVASAMEATFEVASKQEPLHVKIDEVTCFPKREDNPCPIIGKVKSPELQDFNKALRKKFDKDKVKFDKTFKDYKPHVTLAYADEEIKTVKIEPVEFFVNEIVLWGGDNGDDRIFVTFPLKNSEKKKNAFLLQKADIFHKLSTKDPAGVLKQTTERRSTVR